MNQKPVTLIASGDLRDSANQVCWPAQQEMETALTAAVGRHGRSIVRGHQWDAQRKHGFIASQREGIEVFRNLDGVRFGAKPLPMTSSTTNWVPGYPAGRYPMTRLTCDYLIPMRYVTALNRSASRLPSRCSARKRSWECLTKAVWECSMRSSRIICSIRWASLKRD